MLRGFSRHQSARDQFCSRCVHASGLHGRPVTALLFTWDAREREMCKQHCDAAARETPMVCSALLVWSDLVLSCAQPFGVGWCVIPASITGSVIMLERGMLHIVEALAAGTL